MALDPQDRSYTDESRQEPPNLGDIEVAIQKARLMEGWGENWDGQGAMGYSDATLDRASRFLLRCAKEVWQRHGREMPVPAVGPGPEGSLDFHWRLDERELLLNLPAGPDDMVDFYGDTSSGEAIKGRVYAATVGPWLLAWLTQ